VEKDFSTALTERRYRTFAEISSGFFSETFSAGRNPSRFSFSKWWRRSGRLKTGRESLARLGGKPFSNCGTCQRETLSLQTDHHSDLIERNS